MRVTITDNLFIEVIGNTVFIGHCDTSFMYQWSSNPDFIEWIKTRHDDSDNPYYKDSYHSLIYNEVYSREFSIHSEKLWDIVGF